MTTDNPRDPDERERMPFFSYRDASGTQRRFEIKKKLSTIGCQKSNDLSIDDSKIKPQHAHILKDGDSFMISSLDPKETAGRKRNIKDRISVFFAERFMVELLGSEWIENLRILFGWFLDFRSQYEIRQAVNRHTESHGQETALHPVDLVHGQTARGMHGK